MVVTQHSMFPREVQLTNIYPTVKCQLYTKPSVFFSEINNNRLIITHHNCISKDKVLYL